MTKLSNAQAKTIPTVVSAPAEGSRVKVKARKVGAGRTATILAVRTLRSGRIRVRVQFDLDHPGDERFTADSVKLFAETWWDFDKFELIPS